MPIQRLKPHNDLGIEIVNGQPKTVTLKLAVGTDFRETSVDISYTPGKGRVTAILNNNQRQDTIGILPGTKHVVVKNWGPEIVDVSW